MNRFALSWCVLALAAATIAGCEKTTDDFQSDALDEYQPLKVGNYILYRLDSTLFIDYGQRDTVIYYNAKDVVEEETTDNLGQPTWRIVRYLRDTASTNEDDWMPSLTYLVTPSREKTEVIENNLRQVKLKLPVKEGYNWLGNSHVPFDPFKDIFPFNNDEDIQYWNYTYQDVGASLVINGKLYDNTLTVLQADDSINVPIFSPEAIALKTKWVEQYAKGIGLVYKEVLMWEYQPPNGGNPGYRHGFGLRLQILGHN